MSKGGGGWAGNAIGEQPRPTRPGTRPNSRMRQGAADPMRGVACQVRGGQAQSKAVMRRTASARCPHRPGIDRRTEGAPRRHATTRTGHANHRQLLSEPIAVDVQCTRFAALALRLCRWKKGLSLHQAGVPRGRPWGEPCSIRAGRRVRDGTSSFHDRKP